VLNKVRDCFQQKIADHGATPEGVYWNSVEAQEIRFSQIIKVCDLTKPFSIIDYGCGYGALVDYLDRLNCRFQFTGFDIAPEMIAKAEQLHGKRTDCFFLYNDDVLEQADYLVQSGIFNLKLDVSTEVWMKHVLCTLERMNSLGKKGFSFNMLTKYSDPDRMRSDLFYADPCFFFDYCKRNFSRNVALLHDYELYDFTILVRK